MDREIKKENQLTVTTEIAADLRQRQTDLSAHRSPARPGDTFLSRRTAAYPVEWLAVEVAEDGRVLVVPLDDHPFTGSRDLELPAGSLGGAAVLRCDLDLWLDAEDLEPELRTGALTAAELEQVRGKRRAIDEDALVPSLLEEEVDGDPEYRHWRQGTLRPALAALSRASAIEEPEADKAPAPGRSESAETPPASNRLWGPTLVAAAVIFAIALPIAWQLLRLNRQLGEQRARNAELEQEQQELQQRLAASEEDRQSSTSQVGRLKAALQAAREASERALAEAKARLEARVRRAFDISAVVNLPWLALGKRERTRAIAGQIEVIDPGDASRLMLSLEVVDPEPYPHYRLRIVQKNSGETIWETDELVKAGGKWLRLSLPVDLFEAEVYELLIYGLGSGEPQLLKERYAVKLER